ncbi:hypothetical protein BGZ46_001498 [Entomortierella lignicola]|nr:hypothetical protein BGZ46_001498 [Entomortierella lignicola]
MNFLFASNSNANANANANAKGAPSCNTALATTCPDPSISSTLQDFELLIEIESSFNGVLLGLPEESPGAVLNATAILHVRKKPIRASKLTATFDGRITVQCSDGATFGPEQYRERVLAHKDWVLWEAGSSNPHNTGSNSKNHIPIGTHYYPLSIQLDGALPPSFSGKHGSIRYILSSTLLRPIFFNDIHAINEIEIKRCLVAENSTISGPNTHSADHPAQSDLGALLIDQLSRAGISSILNDGDGGSNIMEIDDSEFPQGPTTITHHNTHKELLRYTAHSPPIAYLEGGLLQVDLTLEPLPPGSYIYSIAYGIKELIYYRSSATGNFAGNKSEILYPIGQQTVVIPRDQERERSMSSAGAGASTRQLLVLRPCPLLTNVDIMTPLIEIQHRITCNVVVVRSDSVCQRNSISGEQVNGTSNGGGGGILRRFTTSQSQPTPNLTLVDSLGIAVNNNAIFLGEPTRSIMEPVVTPVTLELNDLPPPPSTAQLESTILEFPIILTSRYPSNTTTQDLSSNPISYSGGRPAGEELIESQPLSASNQSSFPSIATTLQTENRPEVQRFVHNQEIPSTIIPTTGTAILEGSNVLSEPPGSLSSSVSSHMSSDQQASSSSLSSSLQSSPSIEAGDRDSFAVEQLLPSDSGRHSISNVNPHHSGVRMESGISAGLRAAAAASGSGSTPESRPPSYGRHNPPVHGSNQEGLPKYEDIVDESRRSEPQLGTTIPHSTPMPVPVRSSYHRNHHSTNAHSMSPQPSSFLDSSSPLLHQSLNSFSDSRAFSSSPVSPPSREGRSFSSSPISPFRDHGRYLQSSSSPPPPLLPVAIPRGGGGGHTRTRSTTSMLLATSLARSQGQAIPMTSSTQPNDSNYNSGNTRHQRQRSLGTSVILGSLGRNGGYLSQQPSSLVVSTCTGSSAMPTFGSYASPPAYADA